MKKIFTIITLALGFMAFSGCTEEAEPVKPEAKISVVESKLAIPAKGGEAKVVLDAKGQVKVDMDAQWCTYTVNGSEVTFSAGENLDLQPRYAKVNFTVEDEYVTLTVHQFGYFSCDFATRDIMIPAFAATYDFPYEYSEVLTASTTADWITLTVTEDNLKVEIAENKTEATADSKSRIAEIPWKLGIEEGVITVEQFNSGFMQPDANWTVAYDGYKDYNGEKYEHIKNTVADPTISGKYYFTYFEKEELAASGLEIGDFITTIAPALKAEADETIDYYKDYGYSLTYEDLLYEESDFEIFDKFEDGDYYACVIGFDKDFHPTGHYAAAEFTKTNDGPATGYAAWLGDWTCPHGKAGTKSDTWTFTEKEKGLTYWVSGIEGYTDLKIVAEYDESTEGIIVRGQTDLGTMTIGSKGECSMGFYGASSSGSFWPTADIFTATIDDSGEKAQLAPITFSTDEGDKQAEIAAYIGQTSSGSYTLPKSFDDATRINAVLTKVGGGSDNPGTGGGSGSADFNKFIGSWTVTPADATRGDWTTRLVEVTPDAEIAAYDWQEWTDDWVTPATVTYKDKKIAFNGGTGVPLAENVSIGAPEDPCTIYYMGFIKKDGNDVYINSGTGMYEACEGAFDNDGNIVLTGLEVELSDGSKHTFAGYGIAAVGSDGKSLYSFLNDAGEFPVTMKKASGSKSVKTFGNNRWNLSIENAVKVDPSHVLKMKEPELIEMTACAIKSEPARRPKFIVK